MNILDRLPAWLDRLLYTIVGASLAVGLPYAQANYTSWHLSPPLLSLIGLVLPVAIAAATPLTAQFGKGASNGDPFVPDLVANATDSPDVSGVGVGDVTQPAPDAPLDPSAADTPPADPSAPSDPTTSGA